MKRKIVLFALVLCLGVTLAANSVLALTYGVDATTVDWGVNAYDAEKTLSNSDDDLMCWAAAASNILAWTGWGFPTSEGFSNEDDIFGYYQGHWTDQGGLMGHGWDWWFDGAYSGPTTSGWSQVSDPGGGFWDPPYSFGDYFYEDWSDYFDSAGNAMSTINSYLHSGYGTTLAIYRPDPENPGQLLGHAITVWGYDYEEIQGQTTYKGLWITDSDDDKGSNSPPDELRYYDVSLSGGRWHLQNYRGKDNSPHNSWYIGGVQALDRKPDTGIVPESGTLLLLGLGLIGTIALKRRIVSLH